LRLIKEKSFFSNKELEIKKKKYSKLIDNLSSSLWMKYVYLSRCDFIGSSNISLKGLATVLCILVEARQIYIELDFNLTKFFDLDSKEKDKKNLIPYINNRLHWLQELIKHLATYVNECKIKAAQAVNSAKHKIVATVDPMVITPIRLLEDRLRSFPAAELNSLYQLSPGIESLEACFQQLQQLEFDDSLILLWITDCIGNAFMQILNKSLEYRDDYTAPFSASFSAARANCWTMLNIYHKIDLFQLNIVNDNLQYKHASSPTNAQRNSETDNPAAPPPPSIQRKLIDSTQLSAQVSPAASPRASRPTTPDKATTPANNINANNHENHHSSEKSELTSEEPSSAPPPLLSATKVTLASRSCSVNSCTRISAMKPYCSTHFSQFAK
jgi:hypothetical protein